MKKQWIFGLGWKMWIVAESVAFCSAGGGLAGLLFKHLYSPLII